jgi:TP901 family phage tail tape measure protein
LAYDGTLKFDTSIDSKGFQSGIDGIGSIAEKGLKATGAILAGTATAIGAIGAASVKVGSDFEASMSKVAAISGATGDDLKALTDKAKEMGATTKFSASESADALQYMAMAGWKTDDMLNGLEGIMNLAAASGEDLATTSDIVTDALTAFGLSAEDSTHFADVLAQASSNANTNVGMMGETFKYVAPVAGALGYTAEDTALAIGLMANSGIKASQAGTSLRSIMSRMAKPTKEVQGAMDKLKVSLTDSNGNMKSLNEVMGDLRKGFAGLSEAEAAEMAAALGGQEAMSGLLAIVNASDDDFDKLSDAIYSCDGAAKRMADTMNDNLQGQITILKSGLEGLGISLYENMEAPLKEVVKEAQNMVQQLQDAFNNGGLDSLVTKAGEVMAQIVTEVAQAAPKLIGTAENLVGSFIQGIVDHKSEFASAGATMVAELVRAIMDVAGDMWSAGIYLFTEFLQAMTDHSEEMGQSFGEMISKIGEAVQTNLPLIIQAAKDFVAGFCQGLSEEFPGVSALLDGFFQGFLDTAGDIVQGIVDLIGDIFSVIDSQDPATMEAIGKAIGTIAASIAALKVASEVVGGVKSLLSVLGGFRKTAGSIIGIVPKVVEGFQLLSGGAGTFSEVLALEFPKLAGIITKVTGSLGTLVSTISGIFTKIGAVVGPAISKIASLISSIGPTIAGIGAVIVGAVMAITNFFGMLKDGFSWVKEALMVIGITIAAVGAVILGAPALVAAVVAGIVAAVATLVVVIKDHWTQIVDFFKGIPDKIGEVVDSIVAWFQELPGRISTWLTNTITAISEWGSELYTNITTFVSEAISAVGDWFSQLPYKIGYALGTAIGTIIQWGINVKDWVTTELPKIIQSVVDWFSQLPGRIWTWLVNTVNNVIQWGQNLYSTMTTAATNAINSVTSWFQQLPGKIWTWLVNTVTKVGQWAIDLKNKGVEAAQSLVNAVIDGVSSLPGKMKEVGVNIVNGVWSGICSAKDKFVSDVKSFFSGIVDGVKDALDINSPSRVMKKEVGRWIPPGVGEGIEEEMPELYDQTDEEMAKLAEHMQAAVDVETGKITVRSKAQAEHTADTEMPTGGDTYIDEHIEQENNYHTPVATPSEVSKAQREAARKLLGGVK